MGEKDTNKKSFRHYDEFTKRFDLNWTKIGFRGKWYNIILNYNNKLIFEIFNKTLKVIYYKFINI